MTYAQAKEAADYIRAKFDREVKTAVVLGSGLDAFADEIENAVSISFDEIPHFSRATVEGHAGKLVLGEVEGVTVAVQRGRFHYYEGYDMPQVVFPVRALGVLGIETLILTNAAGSVNTDFKQGSLMLIRDHLNLLGANPLRGVNDSRFGPRFPDMTEVYWRDGQEIVKAEAKRIAKERGIKPFLNRGVYGGLSGPSYETPAEIHWLRFLGADAVGMSTVPEAIVARHQGVKIIGISCITNMAAGITNEPIDHEHVMETGAQVADIFKELLRGVIRRLGA